MHIWWGEEAGRDTAWVQEKDGNGWGEEAGGNERASMSGRLRQRGCTTMDGDGVGEKGCVSLDAQAGVGARGSGWKWVGREAGVDERAWMRGRLRTTAADGNVVFTAGSSCGGRRLGGSRRLQTTGTVTYDLVFPASLGALGSKAAADQAITTLSAATVETVSTALTTAMESYTSLANVVVTVESVSVPVITESGGTSPEPTDPPPPPSTTEGEDEGPPDAACGGRWRRNALKVNRYFSVICLCLQEINANMEHVSGQMVMPRQPHHLPSCKCSY
eukprot:s181_g19.t1